ncbi:Helix-loop-helix DNA-binding domain superfamily [Sesbania bispinosa]|nr:Helix-loop-helix DNA-binding domain superfamily [Sesbania bispinosa]
MANSNWVFDDDYGYLDLDPPNFSWSSSPPPTLSVELDDSYANSDGFKEAGSKKRFVELGSILDPGRPPKMDKAVILSDAVRVVSQLREEAQKLKESTENLQEKINELKAEKNELRDEKQRLKTEKDNLEQKLKALNSQPSFLHQPPTLSAAFPAPGQVVGSKLVPFMGYPGVSMWQFLPPAAVDTSQDHVLRPPVA